MPKFTTSLIVINSGSASVSAHVGASLVGASDHVEYFNTSEDCKHTFPVGRSTINQYLTANLGAYQEYHLYVVM